MPRIVWVILRAILGVVIGVVTSMVTIKVMEWVGHQLFPMPDHIDVTDPASIAAHMDVIPLGSKILVVVGWALASLIGGVAAGRIAGLRWASWTPGVVTLLGMVAIAFMIPHPASMLASGAIAIMACTVLADRLGPVREITNG